MSPLIKFYFSNMPEAKSRALDNLGRVHARVGHFQKAIDVYVSVKFLYLLADLKTQSLNVY